MADNVNIKDSAIYYDKFHSYLVELLESYTKLADLLSMKLDAVVNFNSDALDGIIKEEQVFVLLARGFDANLKSYRDKLGLKGESLSAVINEMLVEYQPDFQAVFAKLCTRLDEVRLLNEKCQSLTEERIYRLECLKNRMDHSSTASYGKPGSAPKPAAGGESRILHVSV